MRIAVVQTPGVPLRDWRATLTLVESLLRQAAGQGAELAVVPECAWPAYVLGSREAYQAAAAEWRAEAAAAEWRAEAAAAEWRAEAAAAEWRAEPALPRFVQRLQQLAGELRLAICAGHVAERGGRLFNSATLIEADGRIAGTRHKTFLWDFDRDSRRARRCCRSIRGLAGSAS